MDDANVVSRLEELHPAGHHVRIHELPGAVDTKLSDPQNMGAWTRPVLRAVADFPRGSAPGPSGL